MTDEPKKSSRAKIFISYAHEDRAFLEQLLKHLAPLKRQGMVSTWSDRNISAGQDWHGRMTAELVNSDIVLLLVSPDYLASSFAEREIREALTIGEKQGKRVLPVILRPSLWEHTPLARWQVLPRGGRSVTEFRNTDEAWVDIVRLVRRLAEEVTTPPVETKEEVATEILQLFEVFKPSGIPTVTFVAPPRFSALKLSMAQPGRGLVVEGPSGIGKTTALKTAQQALSAGDSAKAPKIEILSARRPEDVLRLQKLPEEHSGTIVADDFHRLPRPLRALLADYLKYLADYEASDRKLIIAGIPRLGELLVQYSFDLATRIDVFRLGRVKDDLVLEMIRKGEQALNVRFERPTEIVKAASGSLNVAQLLCFHLCVLGGVEKTQPTTHTIEVPAEDAIAQVIEQVEPKFGQLAKFFASLGGRHDLTSIEILQELARTDDGFLSIEELRVSKPGLSDGLQRFIRENQMDRLYQTIPDARTHILFDSDVPALIIDDPQLTFYLAQTPTSKLMRLAGKSEAPRRDQVFVSYSHRDADWLERLRDHLKPLEREGIVKLWDDTKIRAGSKWREEIAASIDAAKVAILLVSAKFLASDFVMEHELPPLLAAAEEDGALILPVIVSPCRFQETPSLSQFQAVNSPSAPLSSLTYTDQEKVLLEVARGVELVLRENSESKKGASNPAAPADPKASLPGR